MLDAAYNLSPNKAHCSLLTCNFADAALQLVEDNHSSDKHGIVQVRTKGLWGRMCRDNFGEKEANVTCRMLGFMGGVPYTHIASDKRPFTISNVSCKGHENSIFDCSYENWSSPENCKRRNTEAGVLCYNVSGESYIVLYIVSSCLYLVLLNEGLM